MKNPDPAQSAADLFWDKLFFGVMAAVFTAPISVILMAMFKKSGNAELLPPEERILVAGENPQIKKALVDNRLQLENARQDVCL
jgi:hypothetical protein